MADKTEIAWTDSTWNPTRGCSRISDGCGGPNHQGGCYAEKMAARFSDPGQAYDGFAVRTKHGGAWTGKVELVEHMLDVPLRWKKPRKIFVDSMSDLFHENLPDEAIDRVFQVIQRTPQHVYQILTKRTERMRRYFEGLTCDNDKYRPFVRRPGWSARDPRDGDRVMLLDEGQTWPLPNVWLGTSVENQAVADERIPHLCATPAAVRFLSCEPLLGQLDLTDVSWPAGHLRFPDSDDLSDSFNALRYRSQTQGAIDWVITGAESGRNARPCNIDWIRSLRDQCVGAGVPFFYKQFADANGHKIPSPELDGRQWLEFPRSAA